jgi:hypothetical protein
MLESHDWGELRKDSTFWSGTPTKASSTFCGYEDYILFKLLMFSLTLLIICSRPMLKLLHSFSLLSSSLIYSSFDS